MSSIKNRYESFNFHSSPFLKTCFDQLVNLWIKKEYLKIALFFYSAVNFILSCYKTSYHLFYIATSLKKNLKHNKAKVNDSFVSSKQQRNPQNVIRICL